MTLFFIHHIHIFFIHTSTINKHAQFFWGGGTLPVFASFFVVFFVLKCLISLKMP